jgi:hypothetical protein
MIHRRTSRRGNRDTPEDVLLQVSLTLVVFLGFLLSLQAATQRDLDKRVDAVEKGAPFEHALEDTPGAASRAVRVAEREREMMQLLREWERLKQRWPLFRLVGRFDVSEGGGGVGLMRALDGNGLLALDDFDRFQKEVARLLIESDRPAPRPTAVDLEVDACVDACLRSAGLRRPPLDASTGGAAGRSHIHN